MGGCEGEMRKEYILSPEALVLVQGSSKGAQPKYYDKGYWYKADNLGYEGMAEYLASQVLACSNVQDFVNYELCIINGRNGCRSRNFTGRNEYFMSFQRLYELYTGVSLQEKIRRIPEVSERLDYVVEFVREHTGLDCTAYLSRILTLDMLILNTDRHFNNLGIVVNASEGTYRPAPIFDNGNSLLSDWERFSEEELEQNLEKVVGQPFSANLEVQAKAAGFGLRLDYRRLEKLLETLPQSRGLTVLKYQLKRYRKVILDIWSESHMD